MLTILRRGSVTSAGGMWDQGRRMPSRTFLLALGLVLASLTAGCVSSGGQVRDTHAIGVAHSERTLVSPHEAVIGVEPGSQPLVALQEPLAEPVHDQVQQRSLFTLTHEEAANVIDAERGQNLAACLSGGSTCRALELTREDQAKVAAVDYERNLAACLSGSSSCRLSDLTDEERGRVAVAAYEKNEVARSNYPPAGAPAYVPRGGCAENGSCYGDASNLTGLQKTVHVGGYYRSNGTYVRGHYRSRR